MTDKERINLLIQIVEAIAIVATKDEVIRKTLRDAIDLIKE